MKMNVFKKIMKNKWDLRIGLGFVSIGLCAVNVINYCGTNHKLMVAWLAALCYAGAWTFEMFLSSMYKFWSDAIEKAFKKKVEEQNEKGESRQS